MAIRSTDGLKFSAAACLFLAGCGGGSGNSTINALLGPIYGNNLSSDALAAFFINSFDAFEDRARELRDSSKYVRQDIRWQSGTGRSGPIYDSYSLASARIEYAHAVGLTGAGQTISIVDDGFLATHESISNRVAIGSVTGAAESHGTAVASVAAGNSSTFIGVAPGPVSYWEPLTAQAGFRRPILPEPQARLSKTILGASPSLPPIRISNPCL